MLKYAELIKAISKDTRYAQADVSRVLGSMVKHIQASVADGAEVKLGGLGKFERHTLPARTIQHPATRKACAVPLTRAPKFLAAAEFKAVLNLRKGGS